MDHHDGRLPGSDAGQATSQEGVSANGHSHGHASSHADFTINHSSAPAGHVEHVVEQDLGAAAAPALGVAGVKSGFVVGGISGVMNGEGHAGGRAEEAWQAHLKGMEELDKRWRQRTRTERVESSWEDVPSDDEEGDDQMRRMRGRSTSTRDSTSVTTPVRSSPLALEQDDQWEDEDSSEGDSDSAGSSATEAQTRVSAKGDDETVRGTPHARSSRLPRRSSAQRALREYRNSKLALLQSESNNVDRYNRIMRGEPDAQEAEEELTPTRRELRRSDTVDLLQSMEPFTAGASTESVDEAEGASRAHELSFRTNGHASAPEESSLRATSHSRRGSQVTNVRSPRLAARRTSASPVLNLASLAPTSHHKVGTPTAPNSARAERYASEPASPSGENTPTASNPQWFVLEDGSKDAATQRASGHIADVKLPSPLLTNDAALPKEPQTPRRLSKNTEGHSLPVPPSAQPPASAKQPSKRGATTTPELLSAQLDRLADAAPPFSLWDYLKEEVMASDFDSTQEMKWERVTNFIAIPFWMEKIMLFGFFVCLDSFLYTFTILPLRFLVAVCFGARNLLVWLAGGQRHYLSSSHKCDILKTLLIVSSCFILSRITDASKMYHSVRGQDVVKLYVIFNVLEIADRLCCSFGQDLLDSLFSRSTLARRKDGRQPYLRPLGFFALSLLYVLAHTLVLLYQLVTLNVAINSYDNALLTLLLSNQFVEIKGSVFKKFEKENLFQLTCADIVERFQLTLMLCSIGMRNLIEVAGAAGNSVAAAQSLEPEVPVPSETGSASFKASSPLSALAMMGPLPTSFTVFPSFSLLETIFTPVAIVLASEYLVDWLKHAFITKFNHIRPSVYGRFMDVLCRDLVMAGPLARSSSRRKHTFVDQSPVVSRRLGFASVPLACLLVRMTSQVMDMLRDDSHFDECSVPDFHRQGTAGQSILPPGSIIAVVWHVIRRPFLLLLHPFVRNPEKTLDLVAHYAWSAAAWVLTIIIAWIFLVGIKLLLGTNLVSFASRRYATMAQRESEEELNARDRQPIGVDKEEIAYDAKVAQLIDKGDDDASRMGVNGQPLPTPVKASASGKSKPNTSSLMDVGRYTMIRSRIW